MPLRSKDCINFQHPEISLCLLNQHGGELQGDRGFTVNAGFARHVSGSTDQVVESHLNQQRVSRINSMLEFYVIDPGENRKSAFADNALAHHDGTRLKNSFKDQDARHDRSSGIMPFEKRFFRVDFFFCLDEIVAFFKHSINKQERRTVGNVLKKVLHLATLSEKPTLKKILKDLNGLWMAKNFKSLVQASHFYHGCALMIFNYFYSICVSKTMHKSVMNSQKGILQILWQFFHF